MTEELKKQLIEETTLEDIVETKRPVAEITGIEVFARLGEYARGDELYFPSFENIIVPARNRMICREYNGYNMKELADKFEITIKHIASILKDVPHPSQINMFEWMEEIQ